MRHAHAARTTLYLGAFSHSANYDIVYPGNTPETHPPTEACMINSKQHAVQNAGPWDPWLQVVENSRLFAQRTVRPLCSYPTVCAVDLGAWKIGRALINAWESDDTQASSCVPLTHSLASAHGIAVHRDPSRISWEEPPGGVAFGCRGGWVLGCGGRVHAVHTWRRCRPRAHRVLLVSGYVRRAQALHCSKRGCQKRPLQETRTSTQANGAASNTSSKTLHAIPTPYGGREGRVTGGSEQGPMCLKCTRSKRRRTCGQSAEARAAPGKTRPSVAEIQNFGVFGRLDGGSRPGTYTRVARARPLRGRADIRCGTYLYGS